MPEAGVEANLVLLRKLRLEIQVADTADGEARHRRGFRRPLSKRDGRRREKANGVAEVGALTALAVRRAQPERRYDVLLREEAFLADHPREAGGGIHDAAEVLAEGAVLIGAHRASDEQPFAPCELLLDVRPGGLVLDVALADGEERRSPTE